LQGKVVNLLQETVQCTTQMTQDNVSYM